MIRQNQIHLFKSVLADVILHRIFVIFFQKMMSSIVLEFYLNFGQSVLDFQAIFYSSFAIKYSDQIRAKKDFNNGG